MFTYLPTLNRPWFRQLFVVVNTLLYLGAMLSALNAIRRSPSLFSANSFAIPVVLIILSIGYWWLIVIHLRTRRRLADIGETAAEILTFGQMMYFGFAISVTLLFELIDQL